MNLCCEEVCENTALAESTSRGAFDEKILNDSRVLKQLLKNEERHFVSTVYNYNSPQNEINPEMRKVLSLWMLEVCEELKCDEIVFPLAVNYVDRYLLTDKISKSQLQLLGAVCLLIASKLRQCEAIHSEDLVYYSDHSLTIKEIIAWELKVLSRLKWDISSVVATDFVDHLLVRLRLNKDQLLHTKNAKSDKKLIETIRRHTSTFIALCSTDLNLSMFPPSMIAAASIGTAFHNLIRTDNPLQSQQHILKQLSKVTGIEVDCLRNCQQQIEAMMASYIPSAISSNPTNSATDKLVDRKTDPHESVSAGMLSVSSGLKLCNENNGSVKPETPTDVQDIDF